MATLQERVTRGMAFLDEARPGWDKHIALERLDQNQCGACIVGQLFKWYDTGMDTLGLGIDNDSEENLAVAYGFCIMHDEGGYWLPSQDDQGRLQTKGKELEGWLMLTACWEDAIRARRRAART